MRVGVLGGSGLYDLPGLSQIEEIKVTTPFGDPSDAYLKGSLADVEVYFLARHGRGHRVMPSDLNFRANIFGFKQLGVDWIISVSAVGSMREDLAPSHILVPDQFYDHTRNRRGTFFGEGVVVHVALADPVCPNLSEILFTSGENIGATIRRGGTYICIEGPQFSTRGESMIYRTWGVDVIGMTNMPEAKLAREAEICYATLAMVTDYDCWHEDEDDVDVEQILRVLQENASTAQGIIADALPRIAAERACACANALQNAIITDVATIPPERLQQLDPLIGKYLRARQEKSEEKS